MCVCVCVRACVRECARACVRACMRACVRVCVRVCFHLDSADTLTVLNTTSMYNLYNEGKGNAYSH